MPPAKRILIVDDDPFARRSLGRLLRHVGYEVFVDANSADVVSVVVGLQIDAVLLDYGLPDKLGDEVLGELRSFSKTLPVVIVSGQLDDALSERLLAGGANHCLDKPANPAVLLLTLRRLLF